MGSILCFQELGIPRNIAQSSNLDTPLSGNPCHLSFGCLAGWSTDVLFVELCLYCFRFFERERERRSSPNAGESSNFEAFLVSF